MHPGRWQRRSACR